MEGIVASNTEERVEGEWGKGEGVRHCGHELVHKGGCPGCCTRAGNVSDIHLVHQLGIEPGPNGGNKKNGSNSVNCSSNVSISSHSRSNISSTIISSIIIVDIAAPAMYM